MQTFLMRVHPIPLVAALLIVVPAFFSGGRDEIGVFLFFVLLGIYAYLNRSSISGIQLGVSHVVLVAFVLWATINAFFFSVVSYLSVQALLPLLGGTALFLIGLSHEHRKTFAHLLLGGAVLLLIIGFVFFIQSENYSYLRLTSLFFSHNAFAGFLIVPFLISAWNAWKSEGIGSILAYALFFFFATGFFLTFSRGGMISVFVALIIFLFFAWRGVLLKKEYIKKVAVLGLLMAMAWGSAWGIWNMISAKGNPSVDTTDTSVESQRATVVQTPYFGERSSYGETGLASRFHYMGHAKTLFFEKPIVGYGLGTFSGEARRVQEDVRFYSTDPHNLFLRLFAELGFLGGALFMLFVMLVAYRAFRHCINNKDDLLYAALFSGFIGLIIHNGGDVDFQFPVNVMLFFAIASILITQKTRHSEHYGNTEKKWQASIAPVFLVVGFVLTLYFLATSYLFTKATDAVERRDTREFWSTFENAHAIDPWNPFLKIYGAHVYFGAKEYDKASFFLDEALKLNPGDRDALLLRATLALRNGENENAETIYRDAIARAPYKDLDAVIGLVNLLMGDNRKDEAVEEARLGLERFPDNSFNASIWVNPNREKTVKQLESLKDFLKTNQD